MKSSPNEFPHLFFAGQNHIMLCFVAESPITPIFDLGTKNRHHQCHITQFYMEKKVQAKEKGIKVDKEPKHILMFLAMRGEER